MHDVFTEGVLDESNTDSGVSGAIKATTDDEVLIGLEEANKKIDELSSVCETKDNEVSSLNE